MADPLSVAGLAAGVVSLGLQICGGITKYIDALECREQDIASVRQQNDRWRRLCRWSKHRYPNSIQSTKRQRPQKELKALNILVADLASCGQNATGRRDKIKSRGKKLLYPFNRPKIEQLETRLCNANSTLQLALQALGLAMSRCGTEKLSRLESTSHSISAGLVVLQSDMTAISTSLECLLRHMLVVPSPNNSAIAQRIALETTTHRLTKKPQLLRDLCNDAALVQARAMPDDAALASLRGGDQFHKMVSSFVGGNFACSCRLNKVIHGKSFVWGPLAFSLETATQGHFPGCPAAQVIGLDQNQKIGLKYTGLRRLLDSAIQLSFSMKSGAGGWSISPNFTYYPTVDEGTAPAFRALRLLGKAAWEMLAALALAKILRLFRDRKASPLAVNSRNQSLVHYVAELLGFPSSHPKNKNIVQPLLEILRCLITYKTPAADYDIYGSTPLEMMFEDSYFTRRLSPGIFNARVAASEVIFQSSEGVTPAFLLQSPHKQDQTTTDFGWRKTNGVLYLLSSGYFPKIAEAYGCGPLSLAILANDQDQVRYLLKHHPAALNERNLLGQSPLHLAANRPSCLRILAPAADSTLLNDTDRSGKSALGAALLLSASRCRNGVSRRRCRRCRCAESAVILIKANCALSRTEEGSLQSLLKKISQRCKLRYIRYFRDRREILKQLALQNFSEMEAEHLGLRSLRVLDSLAPQVVKLLQQRGVQIPAALAIEAAALTETPPTPSVYQALWNSYDAEMFFKLGFQDTDAWGGGDRRSCQVHHAPPLSYVRWLALRGVDPLFRMRPESGRGIFTAHHTFWRLGQEFLYGKSQFLTAHKAWTHELSVAGLRADIRDNCRCRCSLASCTPLIYMLKGMFQTSGSRFGHRDEAVVRATARAVLVFTDYLSFFEADLDIGHHLAALRFFTFSLLGIPHRCGDPFSFEKDSCTCRALPSTEVDETQDEHAYELALLEDLMDEFEDEITTILQGPDRRAIVVVDFWRHSYLKRMREIQEQLRGNDLSEGERRAAEEIGVVWDRGEPTQPGTENPHDEATLDHWIYELEKIEG